MSTRSSIHRFASGVLRAVAAFVFPDRCLSCGAPVAHGERHLCLSCRAILTPRGMTASVPPGAAIDGVIYVLPFHGPARALVRALKYGHRLSVAAELAAAALPEAARLAAGGADALVPVPLHRTRRRERGFNQSEIIARVLGARLDLPVAPLLRRLRATRTQTGLARPERLRNVEGAFSGLPSLAGMRVIVVDDVVTTGATIAAACGAALQAGAARAVALAIAGPREAAPARRPGRAARPERRAGRR